MPPVTEVMTVKYASCLFMTSTFEGMRGLCEFRQ
jgi:hypothetical protein